MDSSANPASCSWTVSAGGGVEDGGASCGGPSAAPGISSFVPAVLYQKLKTIFIRKCIPLIPVPGSAVSPPSSRGSSSIYVVDTVD